MLTFLLGSLGAIVVSVLMLVVLFAAFGTKSK